MSHGQNHDGQTKSIGLGFVPEESRHGFLIHIPKGSAKGDLISISEYRGDRFSGAEVTQYQHHHQLIPRFVWR